MQYKIAFPTETAARISIHTMRMLASRINKMSKKSTIIKLIPLHDKARGFPVWALMAIMTRTSDYRTSLINLRKMLMKLTLIR